MLAPGNGDTYLSARSPLDARSRIRASRAAREPPNEQMPTSPGTLGIIASFVGLFLGGAAVGGALADMFAPESWIASVAGFFALPVAFAVGLQAWYGLALLSVIPRLLEMVRGSRGPRDPRAQATRMSIPGSFVFLPLSSGAGAIAGIVVGLASSTQSAWLVALVYWLVGTGHGALAWRLARGGFLMPPESI